jgi:hypothetical protein
MEVHQDARHGLSNLVSATFLSLFHVLGGGSLDSLYMQDGEPSYAIAAIMVRSCLAKGQTRERGLVANISGMATFGMPSV